MPAITLDQLPEDCFITIRRNSNECSISYTGKDGLPYKNVQNDPNNKSNRLGDLMFKLSENNPSKLIYEITYSQAANGFGPLLYDIGMEVVNKLTNGKGYLKSDPEAVSRHAKNIWDVYSKRGGVVKKPLDSIENEITPTKLDNVNLTAAKQIYGEKPGQPGESQPWYNKPLSTGFTKPIQLLGSDKIIFNEEVKKIEFKLNEARRSLKVNETTNVITRYVVYSLKSKLAYIKFQFDRRNFKPIQMDKSTYSNKFLSEAMKKNDIKNIFTKITFEQVRSPAILVMGGALFNFAKREITVDIAYNLNGSFDKLLEEMDLFIKQLRERVTHELTHGEQFKKDPDIAKNREPFLANDPGYENIFILIRRKYLTKFEIQAYAKGLMKYYKWPDIFYKEWNDLFRMMLGNMEHILDVFGKNIGTNHAVVYFEHAIALLLDAVMKFKEGIISYLRTNYRGLEIDPSRDFVHRHNLMDFINKNYLNGISGLTPEPPKAPAPGRRKLEID